LPKDHKNSTFTVYDLFEDEGKEIIATLKASDNLKLLVNPAGGVRMVKLVPKSN
jgi:hypothetical protein